MSFNEAKTQLLCLYPRLTYAAMLALLTLAIVASFRAVGTLLVFGLLVAPPASASLVARRVPTMMVTAVAFGALSVIIGLLVSWHAGTAAGATVAAVSVALFFIVLAGRGLATHGPAAASR